MKYINNKSISESKAKLIDFYSAIIGNFSLQLSEKLKDLSFNSRLTWDWRHAFCHKACRLTNHGYEKASFTPVPAEPVTSANPRNVI